MGERQPLSRVWLSVTPWTVARQIPLSMESSRQEYWRGLPFPSPGDLPDPGTEPGSPALQADSLLSEPPGLQLVERLWKAAKVFGSVTEDWGCETPDRPPHPGQKLPGRHYTALDFMPHDAICDL